VVIKEGEEGRRETVSRDINSSAAQLGVWKVGFPVCRFREGGGSYMAQILSCRELKSQPYWAYMGERTRIALTNESHDPVHKLMPSLETPKQLTRFSWPTSEPTFSPRVMSQT
jgi:hypothetical protein